MRMVTVTSIEIDAYAIAAMRGDVLPACIRLAQTREEKAWHDRLEIVLSVGPACPRDVLDRACKLMPHATEPLLLRAAASLRRAAMAQNEMQRDTHEANARADLEQVMKLDPADAAAPAIHPRHGVSSATMAAASSARL